MKDFVYSKSKISIQKRFRIAETRDLINGIRLNRNERVENFEKGIFKKIFSNMNDCDLGKYSDQSEIYKILSKYLKQKQENLIITSGIDGSIKSIFEIFIDEGEQVGVLSPSYAMYEVYGNIFKAKIVKIGYKNFKLQKKEIFKIIEDGKIRILFLPNPNQPIEDNLSLTEIKKILSLCKKKKILLVIDEAYHMFGCDTASSLCKTNENILVLRTFSKSFGLPSIRFGYVIAHKKLIHIFNTYRLSYESNLLSDTTVKYFITNNKIIKRYISQVKQGRDYFKKELISMKFNVIGGKSNFLLIDFKNTKILKEILDEFKKKKIYVKTYQEPNLKTCILLTCGLKKTMNKVLKVIKKIKQ